MINRDERTFINLVLSFYVHLIFYGIYGTVGYTLTGYISSGYYAFAVH